MSQPGPIRPQSSPSGFAASLVLASLPAAAAVSLLGTQTAIRIAAVILVAGTLWIGRAVVVQHRRRSFPLVVVLALAAFGLFAWQLIHTTPPYRLRSLQVAALLAYGAVGLAMTLRLLRLLSEARALLLSFSLALALLVVDALAPTPPPDFQVTPWQVNGTQDPDVGFRYQPHSIAKNFYPDNPRGYFEGTDPVQSSWQIETHEGSTATLEDAGGRRMRVISQIPGTLVWHVKLKQFPFQINRGRRYALRFRVRADANRGLGVAVGQNHAPWSHLSGYSQIEAQVDWKAFDLPFVASASESEARIFFDLGTSNVPVEFADVVLHDVSTDKDLRPDVQPVEFSVSYRFNGLGFRGPDYAIPAPAGAFRILALGDSYTLGVGVHEPDTFEARLEKSLNADPRGAKVGRKYEVINAGVSGYDTRAERISYKLFSSAYRPNLVLLVMVFNDDISFQEEVGRGYISATPELGNLLHLQKLTAAAMRPPRPYDYTSAMRELLDVNAECEEQSAKLAVVVFRNSTFNAWLKLVDAVNQTVQGTGIPVLDLGPALLKIDDDRRRVHPVDDHPSDAAHGVAAVEIERFLRANQLVP